MPVLKNFTPRLYQETIFANCTLKNCLVVLPTGLGKTAIAMMLAAHRLQVYPASKTIMLVPTKPLADQHAASFKKHLSIAEEKITVFTGDISPAERATLWNTVQVIFSTPQGLENDVLGNKISLKDVSLLIVDEAHRAVGDYSYVWLAQQYQQQAQFPRILALTASPGSEAEHIAEVAKNLFIEKVEIRTPKDLDVAPYVQEVHVQWLKVELTPELIQVQKLLNTCIRQRLELLSTLGLQNRGMVSKKDLLGFQKELQAKMASGERDFETLKALSVLAEAVKLHHALELLETQAVMPLNAYLEKLMHEGAMAKTKAAKNIAQDINFKTAVIHVQNLYANNIEHPKMKAVSNLVSQEFQKNKFTKIMIFTQFRDTAIRIQKELEHVSGVVSAVFVGQTKKGLTGLTQKQQAEMLAQFRDGFFTVLIATSVGEEGLDIPKVDTVIFYEPVPSAIRQIQRRGRTGRQEKGSVIILMTKNTRDEAYHWAAVRKEHAMHTLLELPTSQKEHIPVAQTTLSQHALLEEKTVVYADYREKASGVVRELHALGTDIKLEMLHTADYVLSGRVGVEFKTTEDFVNSIIDGRLLEQVKQLREHFIRPLLIIEGTSDMYAVRNIHPNAIRGMIATIIISYGIPLIQTRDAKETASLLLTIARREQEDKKPFNPHTSKKPMNTREAQEYIIGAFPNIGPQLAKELLVKLKTVKNIVNASMQELQNVEGVGEKKATGIKEVSEKEY